MKNKILMFGLLVGIFTFTNNASAVSQNSPKVVDTINQVQQVQANNQGENTPLQEQTQLQTQEAETNDVPVQNQNQQQNQGEENQIQNQETIGIEESGSAIAEQRKSQVANAVHEMLQIAERNSGIGEQVRLIAQAQNQNQEQLESSLEKVQKRNEFTKLFFGPDYGEISKAEQVLEQNREQIEQLSQLQTQLTNQADQQVLTQQIQLLEQANLEIENSLNKQKGGFSLLGWMFKLFNK